MRARSSARETIDERPPEASPGSPPGAGADAPLPTLPCACANLRPRARAVTQLYDEALRGHGTLDLPVHPSSGPRHSPGRSPRAASAGILILDSTTLTRTCGRSRGAAGSGGGREGSPGVASRDDDSWPGAVSESRACLEAGAEAPDRGNRPAPMGRPRPGALAHRCSVAARLIDQRAFLDGPGWPRLPLGNAGGCLAQRGELSFDIRPATVPIPSWTQALGVSRTFIRRRPGCKYSAGTFRR
jgi:hypothetical protein